MEPADKVIVVVAVGVVLTAVGVAFWLVNRGKRIERKNAEREKFDRARMQRPETPPQRPENTTPEPSSSQARPVPSEPANTSTSAASEPSIRTREPAANEWPVVEHEPEDEPERVIVGNRRRCYPVPPGAVVELKTPASHGAFVASRPDVAVHVVDAGPDRVRVQILGPSGPVKIALLEPNDSDRGHRIVSSWKFELLAA